MKLTPAQQKILDEVKARGYAVYDGSKRRAIEALVEADLVEATKEWVPFRQKWRYVVKPMLHVHNCVCDQYARDGRCVDYRRQKIQDNPST